MSDTEKRIELLEERLAFQEDALQKLDDAIADQQRQIMAMEHQLKLLFDQVRKMEALLPDSSREPETPPHY